MLLQIANLFQEGLKVLVPSLDSSFGSPFCSHAAHQELFLFMAAGETAQPPLRHGDSCFFVFCFFNSFVLANLYDLSKLQM